MTIVKLFLFCFIITALSCNSQIAERDIVLINVDTINRNGITREISIVNSLNPKVIAIDLQFSNDTEYDQDTRLIQALDKCKNLIMASVIENYTGDGVEYKRFTYGSLPDYRTNAKTGFINALPERDEFQTLKRFSIVEKVNGDYEYHFGVRTAMAYDSLKAMDFVKSNPRIIDIDYQGGRRKFKAFSAFEVLNKKVSRKDIEGKIVLMGYVGPSDEDKFFSPLNKKTKPYKPDIYGLEYLANIVAQVLNR